MASAVLIGTLVGVTAGYFRGWIGGALMRFTDLMMAFPALLLAIALAAVFQPSLWIVAMVIALVNWVQIARVIYTETRSLAEREFIDAERALGAGARAHPVPPHPAASGADHHRLGHARHLHHRAARGDALLPRHRRAAADRRPGATSSSRTRPISRPRPGWCSFPGAAILAAGAGLQPGRRRAARHPRSDAAGPRLMIAYLARRLSQSLLILLGVIADHLRRCSICCRPTRCARSPGAAPRRRRSRTSATSSASTSRFVVQYWRYLGQPRCSGDLGRSYIQQIEVSELIVVAPAGDPAADGRRHRLRADASASRWASIAAVERGSAADQALMVALLRRRLGAAIRRRRCCCSTSSPSRSAGSRSAATAPCATSCCRR